MKHQPLAAAYGKIERAKTHIDDLNRQIQAFVARKPYTISTKVNANRVKVWSYVPEGIPLSIQNIAADAVHNLRAPLDKMLTAFKVEKEGGIRTRYKGVFFPFGGSRKEFEDAVAAQKKRLTADVADFLLGTEAYPGGKGDLLFALHDMNIEDKHHPFLVPINLGVRGAMMGATAAYFGPLFTLGSRRGQHMVWNPMNGALVQSVPERKPIYRAGPIVNLYGGRLEMMTGAHDDFEFATTAEETVLLQEQELLLNIAFNQIQGLEGEPVVSALHQMRQLVEGILLTFEKRFFS